jgi:hypothetical protein
MWERYTMSRRRVQEILGNQRGIAAIWVVICLQ